jgi:hypothetical protein
MGSDSLRSPGSDGDDPTATNDTHSPALRHKKFIVCLTPYERRQLRELASERGLKMATYVRLCALGDALPARLAPARPIPEINRLTYRQLSWVGNNLNQIARQLNMRDGDVPELHEILGTVDRLAELLREVQAQVIGVGK